jgi:hypothetical protein
MVGDLHPEGAIPEGKKNQSCQRMSLKVQYSAVMADMKYAKGKKAKSF